MENLRIKTDEELIRMRRDTSSNSYVPGSIYHEINFEIQRRNEERNTEQIHLLITEIKKLKNISETNAEIARNNGRSSDRLAKVAIVIAVIGFLTQVILSIHQDKTCLATATTSDPGFMEYTNCYRTFDL